MANRVSIRNYKDDIKQIASKKIKLSGGLNGRISSFSKTVSNILESNDVDMIAVLIVDRLFQKIQDKDFKKRFLPIRSYDGNEVTWVQIEAKINEIMAANCRLSKSEMLKLISDSIEYYWRKKTVAKVPMFHSTSSFTLLKALDEWFEWWHWKYNWEHPNLAELREKIDYKPQNNLSVSTLKIFWETGNHEQVECFQQLYARIACKKWSLKDFLSIDSNDFLDEWLLESFMELVKRESSDFYVALQKQLWDRFALELKKSSKEFESNKAYIADMESDEIKKYLRENIQNENIEGIKEQLRNPFPCFLTFESEDIQQGLLKWSWRFTREVAKVPFEDRFEWRLDTRYIKEIRVPYSKIQLVQKWLNGKWLKDIEIIPIELYEIKRIFDNSN
jgi:hypothetical protein